MKDSPDGHPAVYVPEFMKLLSHFLQLSRCTWHIVSMDIDESSLIIQQLLPWLPAMSQFYASLRVMEQRHSVTVWIWDSLTLCLSGILLRNQTSPCGFMVD